MGLPASRIFNFLENNNLQKFDRYYVYSENFDILRKSVRKMVSEFQNSPDIQMNNKADHLRILISRCLCSPVKFDQNITDELEVTLDTSDTALAAEFFGEDIAQLYKLSLNASSELQMDENPLRVELAKKINEIISRERNFKIFCKKRHRDLFESLQLNCGDFDLKDEHFLHSLPQYRESEIFDDLIKIGPFRSYGWSGTPDSILTAPKYKRLIQILWHNCNDEHGFGYDPVTVFQNSNEEQKAKDSWEGIESIGPINWEKKCYLSTEIPEKNQNDDFLKNEFEYYEDKKNRFDKIPCLLINTVNDRGIFKKISSESLVYNRKKNEIYYEVLEESNPEELFLILPDLDLDKIDFGEILKTKKDQCSKIWKKKLEDEINNDPENLEARLKNAGLDLIHLGQQLRMWCKPTSSVIHAPHSMRNFRILLNVLGFGEKDAVETKKGNEQFWRVASLEISHSRGEAIQTGLQKQEIIDEELLGILSESLIENGGFNFEKDYFRYRLDPDTGISGWLDFLKINSIESGFKVPESNINKTMNIENCDQWQN